MLDARQAGEHVAIKKLSRVCGAVILSPLLEREIANYLLESFGRGLQGVWQRWQARHRGGQFHRRLSIGDNFSPRAKGPVEQGTPSSPPRGIWRRASTPTVKGCDGWLAGPAPDFKFTANSASVRDSCRVLQQSRAGVTHECLGVS